MLSSAVERRAHLALTLTVCHTRRHVQNYMTEREQLEDKKLPRILLSQETLERENDVMALYDAADVYVHPSRSEGWGLGLAEAMARGLPPLLPAYGAPLDFVSNETGFMFPAHRFVLCQSGQGVHAGC